MTEEKFEKFDLNKHVFRLLQEEPFFAALSRRIDKRETNQFPPLAYVSILTQPSLK